MSAHRNSDNNPSTLKPASKTRSGRFRFGVSSLFSFIILYALWIVFSGRFDAFHLTMGLLSSAIVTLVSGNMMFTTSRPRGVLSLWLRLAAYIPWLIWQILLANLHVMYLVFHPKMLELIDPKIIDFESRLKGDFSRTTFANSISLTPGTITVNVTVLGRFSVHCIDDPSGQSLPGQMEAKIAKVFKE